MSGEKILVVEDDRHILRALKYNIEKAGYAVLAAEDGETALKLYAREKPDLLVLDLMLPKIDGLEVCKAVRQKTKTPVIMLTARKEEVDRVLGLELGADDYVTKPFSMRELLARIKAVLRRAGENGSPTGMTFGGLEVDFEKYEVKSGGRAVSLSTKEFAFLKCLVQAAGKALTREQLLDKIWGYDKALEIDTNTVDQHVARLRGKLGAEAARIITVKNVGYRFKVD
ncbi:MAG: response regulator transcription factor [Elusimicrobiales bacterium]|nr:response regulator transcription factor [Elusimicrobiales bacterium]